MPKNEDTTRTPFLWRGALMPLLAALLSAGVCAAQASPTAASPTGLHANEPRISPVMGFNFSLIEQGVHSSAVGWNNLVVPNLSYRLNRHLLFDVNTAWYPLASAYVPVKQNSNRTALRTSHNLLGDTELAGHYEAGGEKLTYEGTATLGLPTGNVRYGLGANQVTYNITNDLEYSIGPFTPELEIGEGNNSSFANPVVHKAYVAVGPLANFQAGTAVDLPANLTLDLRAYEDLPIGDQNVYGTVTRKNKKGVQTTRQVLEGKGAVEDNGLSAELDLPVGQHLLLTGAYERSLIQGLDTASVGLTWTLRAPKIR